MLVAANSKYYVDAKSRIDASILLAEEGYLGPYHQAVLSKTHDGCIGTKETIMTATEHHGIGDKATAGQSTTTGLCNVTRDGADGVGLRHRRHTGTLQIPWRAAGTETSREDYQREKSTSARHSSWARRRKD